MMNTDFSLSFFSSFRRFLSDNTQRSKKLRSLSGFLAAVMLLPLLLGVLACIPVPVGDPEKSRIDPALSGVWLTAVDEEVPLMVLDPYDKRTWLVSWFTLENESSIETAQDESSDAAKQTQSESVIELLRQERLKIKKFALYKGWLTLIEEERFLTLEPKFFEPGTTPEAWYVFWVRLDDEHQLHLAFLGGNVGLDKVETSAQAEEIIRLNLDNSEMFDDPWVYQKVSEDDLEIVHEFIEELGFDLDP